MQRVNDDKGTNNNSISLVLFFLFYFLFVFPFFVTLHELSRIWNEPVVFVSWVVRQQNDDSKLHNRTFKWIYAFFFVLLLMSRYLRIAIANFRHFREFLFLFSFSISWSLMCLSVCEFVKFSFLFQRLVSMRYFCTWKWMRFFWITLWLRDKRVSL